MALSPDKTKTLKVNSHLARAKSEVSDVKVQTHHYLSFTVTFILSFYPTFERASSHFGPLSPLTRRAARRRPTKLRIVKEDSRVVSSLTPSKGRKRILSPLMSTPCLLPSRPV